MRLRLMRTGISGMALAVLTALAQGGAIDERAAGETRSGAPSPVPQRYAELAKEYEAKSRAFSQALQKAKSDEERRQAAALRPAGGEYSKKFLALAREDPKASTALDALCQAIILCPIRSDPECKSALDLLRRDHAADPRLTEYITQVGRSKNDPNTEALLRAILERNPDRDAQGRACLALAAKLDFLAQASLVIHSQDSKKVKVMERAWGPEWVQRAAARDPDATAREAEAMYQRVVDQYADVTVLPRYPGTLGERAGEWFARRNELAVGKLAPEVEGKDIDGRPFKLSDYRGKVVAIVFWASWCGPCMAQVPHERELVKRLEGRPFVLIGVNCDYEEAAARAAMTKRGITWPNWYDGDPRGGPIVRRYHVEGLPMLYVLDPAGVIRYRGRSAEEMGEAIDTLLADRPADK